MNLGKIFCCTLLLSSSAMHGSTLSAPSRTDGVAVTNNRPRFSSSVKALGPVEPTTQVEVSIWLKPHNKADLDFVASDLYDPKSANYRHWLTPAEFTRRYAPTAVEAQTVRDFFTANGLTTVATGPNNFFVRARGTAAAVSNAFRVTLNNYEVDGKVIRGNVEDPFVSSKVAPLVASISGLDNMEYSHPIAQQTTINSIPMTVLPPTSPKEGARKTLGSSPSAASPSGTSLAFNNRCFVGQTSQTFTTSGTLPQATYTGNEYTPAASGCGYTPNDIHTAYNLNALYAEGFDGTGQTIVIVDWCGSPNVMSDTNAFSSQFNLPQLTSSNFSITYTPTPSFCEAPSAEINMDVQWAHAVAPGAKIALVVPPSASFQDLDQGLFYAVNYQLGNVISGSYGSEEIFTPSTVLQTEEFITETASVLGIATNFSTGDSGDYTNDMPWAFPSSVSAPAASPYATAVGGVSVVLNSNSTLAYQWGWGTNENVLAQQGKVTTPPAGSGYFNFGSGGGASSFFLKPGFQAKLPGTSRQLPDVSWVGDPFTGVYVAISQAGSLPSLQYQVYAGTSLACPMFSALWAIANQASGVPLGQAAPYLYTMPASTITDILPMAFKTNVSGTVQTSAGTTAYTANQIAAPLEGTTSYISALWDYPLLPNTAVLLTFGTDTSLATAKGWDNVTGVGVPNAKNFVEFFGH
jgi:subtilase family serine protease